MLGRCLCCPHLKCFTRTIEAILNQCLGLMFLACSWVPCPFHHSAQVFSTCRGADELGGSVGGRRLLLAVQLRFASWYWWDALHPWTSLPSSWSLLPPCPSQTPAQSWYHKTQRFFGFERNKVALASLNGMGTVRNRLLGRGCEGAVGSGATEKLRVPQSARTGSENCVSPTVFTHTLHTFSGGSQFNGRHRGETMIVTAVIS